MDRRRAKYDAAVSAVNEALAHRDWERALEIINAFYAAREKSLATQTRGAIPPAHPTLYNRVLAALARERNVAAAERVLALAQANPLVRPDAYTYASVIAACARAGAVYAAYKHFQAMLRSDIAPDIVVFNTLLRACDKDAALAQRLWRSMEQAKVQPDVASYSSLIHSFAEAKQYTKARQAYARMLDAKLRPNASTYAALIRAAGHAHLWSRALAYYAQAQAENVTPNLALHRAVMLVYASMSDAARAQAHYAALPPEWQRDEALQVSLLKACARDVVRARDVWSTLVATAAPATLSTAHYASYLYALCRAGDLDAAWALLAEMRERNVRYDGTTFLALLTAFAAQRRVSSSLAVLAMMRAHSVRVTARHYNAALQACRDFEHDAQRVLHDMRTHHDEATMLDVVGYNILINLCAKHSAHALSSSADNEDVADEEPAAPHAHADCGGKEQALKLYYAMRQARLRPDTVTFNTLLKVCGDAGDVHEVARLAAEMDELGVRANALTYRALLRAYRRDGERALQTLRKMQRIGMAVDAGAYAYVMHALRIAGRATEVLALFDELVARGLEPHVEHYGIVISAHAALQHEVDHAFARVHDMKARGLAPTERIASLLLAAVVPSGDVAQVERVLAFVKHEEIPSGEALYEAMLHFYAARHDVTRVRELFAELSATGVRRTWRAWRAWLRTMHACGDTAAIVAEWPRLKGDRVRLDAFGCSVVVDALVHVRLPPPPCRHALIDCAGGTRG